MDDPLDPSTEACSWCGTDVPEDRGFRVYESVRGRHAVFCRLEHIVPWVMRGARRAGGPAWTEPDESRTQRDPARTATPSASPGATPPEDLLLVCSQCGQPLGGEHIVLVHHRDAHRIVDRFCEVEHMRIWAGGGGRWGNG